MKFSKRFHTVELVPISDYAKKILSPYNNTMILVEYNDRGQPLNRCPNGKQGIFCISQDGYLHSWFELDTDVKFKQEYLLSLDIINEVIKDL